MEKSTFKRILATSLAAFMLTPIILLPSSATEEESVTLPLRLTYDNVGEKVLELSPAIISARMEIESLKTMGDVLSDANDGLMGAHDALYGAVTGIQDTMNGLFAWEDGETVDMGARQATYAALASITSLIGQDMSSLTSQATNLYPTDDEIEQAELGVETAENAIMAGAKALFSAYHQLDAQREALAATKITLERQREELVLRAELGQVTEMTIASLDVALSGLDVGDAAMDDGMADIVSQLNLLLGRSYDAPLILAAMPSPMEDFAASRDLEKDTADAIANSISLKLAQFEIDSIKNSGKYDSIAMQKRAKEISMQSSKNEIAYNLQKMLRDDDAAARTIAQATAEAELAALQLEEAELRFELGMISQAKLEEAKEALAEKKRAIESANTDRLLIQQNYLQLVSGIETGGSPMGG